MRAPLNIRVGLLLASLILACADSAHDKPSATSTGKIRPAPIADASSPAPDAASPSADTGAPVADAGAPEAAAPPDAAAMSNWDDPSKILSGRVLQEYLRQEEDGWLALIAAEWRVAAGGETYLCARLTVPRDTLLHEFSVLTSPGTHHALVRVEDSGTKPDGAEACEVDRSGRQIFDSNSFTAGQPGHMLLPDGVAMRVQAGQQLLLNLHLLNPGSERLAGISGVSVQTLEPEQLVSVAQTTLVGPHELMVAPGSVTKHIRCAWPSAATLFAVAPHMHEFGSYMSVTARGSGTPTVLLDGLYSFDWQHVYATDPLALNAGDELLIECTYVNPTHMNVTFGEAANQEMCFAAVSTFPALDGVPTCSESE